MEAKNGKALIINETDWNKKIPSLLLAIVKRALALVGKTISFKAAGLGLATVLLIKGYIKSWEWFLIFVLIIGGRELFKVAVQKFGGKS